MNDPDSRPEAREPEAREPQAREPGATEGERHVSFVQRLQRHFGDDVDPEINLQDADEGGESGDGDSATSLGLVRKLSEQVSVSCRYEVVRQIAQGGMGTILRVWDDDLRRNLAMKVLHTRGVVEESGSGSTGPYDQEKLGRFLEEAQITGQLDHPGIVPVHELGIDEHGRLFFTMRLVRGRELKEVLDLARKGEEDLSAAKALGLILKVCECMAYAHSKGVVHRDLKPSNVMVGRYGEVYVMDWGLARVLGRVYKAGSKGSNASGERKPKKSQEASSLSLVRTLRKDESEANPDSPLITMDGDVVGTPSFMAPEQARGKLDEVGPRCDVYSLGCVLYYFLSGRSPYIEPGERVSPHTVLNRVLTGPPTPIAELAPDQPPELLAICAKAMAREAGDRYAGMLEVADDIEAFLGDRVVRAYERGTAAELRKWVARNRGFAIGVAGMVLVTLAGLVAFFVQKNRRIAELAILNEEKDTVLADLERAKEAADQSAQEAYDNLVLAQEREQEAAQSEALAIAQEREARRSGYMANVLAAAFSDELNDVEEMRERLLDTDPRLREWEWHHLRMRAHPELRDLESEAGLPVDRIRWTRDGKTLLALSRGGRLGFLDPKTGARARESIGRPFLGTAGLPALRPLEMAATDGAARIALSGMDETIQVFDTTSGEPILAIPSAGEAGHGARVGALAFGREGRWLASGADDGSILIWDERGGLFHGFPRRPGAITDLEWSPDSSRIASASTDGIVRVWDVFLGQEVHRLEGHRGPVRCVAWDDLGERLFSGGEDGVVSQWNAERGTLISTFSGHTGAISGLDFDPRSGRLASASHDRTVRVWDPATAEGTVLQGHLTSVLDVAFSPDGTQVVSSAADGSMKVWDPRGDLSTTDLVFHERRVEAVAFSDGGAYVMTGDEAGELVLWDGYSGEPLQRIRDHERAVTAVQWDRGLGCFFSSSIDGRVRQYEIAPSGAAVCTATFAHDDPVTGVLVLPEGRLLTSCADERFRVFQVETQLLLQEFRGGPRSVFDLDMHPAATRFAGTRGSDLVLFDLPTERQVRTLERRGGFEDCAFSPDGQRLVTASRDAVCLWNLDSATTSAVELDHDGRVRVVAFAPTGRRFASGADDGTLRIRDGESGRTVLVIEWPGARVSALAFSSDGSRLIAGSDDGRVRIWETGERGERRRRWLAQRHQREEVSPIVEGLFDGYFYLRDVLGEIQADASLDQELRQTAILLANLRGDDPATLHGQSLRQALLPNQEPQLYEQALRRVEAALEMEGAATRPALHLALGACQYRLGRTRDALIAFELARSLDESLPAVSGEALGFGEEAMRLLFLALAREREGNANLAEAALEEARALVSRHPELLSEEPGLVSLLEEVGALVDGTG